MGILVCTSEVYGTTVFVLAEAMDGFKHIMIVSKISSGSIFYKLITPYSFGFFGFQLSRNNQVTGYYFFVITLFVLKQVVVFDFLGKMQG